jgi:hypothetical protein
MSLTTQSRHRGRGDKVTNPCAQAVYKQHVVPSIRMTSLQGVPMGSLPVGVTALVYAGKRPSYPQSTALITAIEIHTSDCRNAPSTHTMRHQP